MTPTLLTVLERGGLVESRHRGAIAVATADRVLFAAGDVDAPIFPRSAIKPFQALPLVEDRIDERLGLSPRELALTAASHSGDDAHVEAATSLLAKGSVAPGDLLCGVHAPWDDAAARRLAREGREPSVLHHNCSGKHAGMLIQARAAGANGLAYVDPGHPVQQRIRKRLAEFAGLDPAAIGVAIDGCSAPAFALPLAKLAQAFARFAEPPRGRTSTSSSTSSGAEACGRLFDAITAEPHYLSGRRRFDLAVMKSAQRRVVCKGGAEGVVAIALRPPREGLPSVGIALKVDDGNPRGYYLPALELLRWLGLDPPAAADELSSAVEPVQRNFRGLEVGRIELGDALDALPASPW